MAGLGFLTLAAPAASQERIADGPTCSDCEIRFREVLSFGEFDGAGAFPSNPFQVSRDARGRFWVFFGGGRHPPMVFGADGEFISVVGRPGQGPGEYVTASRGLPLPGDSMLVIDTGNARATVVGPDLLAKRTIPLPFSVGGGAIVEWPTRTIFTHGDGGGTDSADVIRVLNFSADRAFETASCRPLQSRAFGASRHYLWLGQGGQLLLVPALRYEVTAWSSTCEELGSWIGRPGWFPGESEWSIGTPTTPPPPAMVGVWRDQPGRVWLAALQPRDQWQQGWLRTSVQGEVRPGDVDVTLLRDVVVEVLDPELTGVISRGKLPGTFLNHIQGDHVALRVLGPFDVPRVVIGVVTLVGLDH